MAKSKKKHGSKPGKGAASLRLRGASVLPEPFKDAMRALLGEEYDAFLASYEESPHSGVRVNTRKVSVERFADKAPFRLSPVPWAPAGFIHDAEDAPARHPWYAAGAYYLQDPSAMLPASLISVKPGDRVLDLCAAPGGKSVALAARIGSDGFLLSNDVSASRAKALVRNLERFGAANMAVTSETPARLAEDLPGAFDAVLVDAPCSGEGMFRRDPKMVSDWLNRGPSYYVPIQREILEHAARMVKPGGYLLYSTCTFCPDEDEGNIAWLLAECPWLHVVAPSDDLGVSSGFAPVEGAVRVFPHRAQGEGHFACLMQASGEGADRRADHNAAQEPMDVSTGSCDSVAMRGLECLPECARGFLGGLANPRFARFDGSWTMRDDRVFFLPAAGEDVLACRFRFLRTGLFAGTVKNDRFEPSQPLAMALQSDEYPRVLDLSAEDQRIARYLRGESFEADELGEADGWTLVCVDGMPLGWGKAQKRRLKSALDAGWRMG